MNETKDMKLTDFLKGKDFGSGESDATGFPEGKTELDLTKVTVQEKEVPFDEGTRKRWILTVGEINYWAGVQIMNGIKDAQEAGFSRVSVIRTGTTKTNTKYRVMPLAEPSQKGDA